MKNLIVFYDGWCPVCRREILYYKKFNDQTIDYVDIRIEDIHLKYGLNPIQLRMHMHSIKDEKVYVGIDTFLNIWEEIPKFKYLHKIFSIKKLRPLYDKAYNFFALKIRPNLLDKKDKFDP